MTGHQRLAEVLRSEGYSVVPYLTGCYPDAARFLDLLDEVSAVAPAVEVGIPFSDPMADGSTVQESSRIALQAGSSVDAVVTAIEKRSDPDTPLVIMSYLNPILAYGVDELMPRLAAAGVCGLVVPDLPLEESDLVAKAAEKEGVGMIQMVTPLTDDDRLRVLVGQSQGFVYAVTMTGTTGGNLSDESEVAAYLDRVRSVAEVPVLAGFGVRHAHQVRDFAPHCDGVIVGSALVERIASGGNPVDLIKELAAGRP